MGLFLWSVVFVLELTAVVVVVIAAAFVIALCYLALNRLWRKATEARS